MSSLYARAAEREPEMRQEALERTKPPDLYSSDTLFELDVEAPAPSVPAWTRDWCWDPRDTDWWPDSDI